LATTASSWSRADLSAAAVAVVVLAVAVLVGALFYVTAGANKSRGQSFTSVLHSLSDRAV